MYWSRCWALWLPSIASPLTARATSSLRFSKRPIFENRLLDKLRPLTNYKLLIMDEIGYLAMTSRTSLIDSKNVKNLCVRNSKS